MSDHDRLDRMERKLNRIGKYVLFGIALFTVLLAVEMQKMSSDSFYGYGRLALWSFIGVMTVMLLVARPRSAIRPHPAPAAARAHIGELQSFLPQLSAKTCWAFG